MSTKTTPAVSWDDLNERQQAYLQAIYDLDQAAEENERGKWKYETQRRPAAEWRQIYYGDTVYGLSPLKTALDRLNLIDQGTGSTFESLRSHGLILVESYHSRSRGDLSSVYVRMTRAGRRLIRAATGEARAKKLPIGTLRSWHWAALALLYRAGGLTNGLDGRYYAADDQEQIYQDGVSWETILRLRDYTAGSLCSESFLQFQQYPIMITEYGRRYYEQEWARYRGLYPEVDASTPGGAASSSKDS